MTSRVLICNTSSLSDDEISVSLSPSSTLFNNTSSLTFNNKYFTVDIELYFSKELPVEEILDTAEAIIFVFEVQNDNALNALEHLKKFDSFLEEQDPEIKLLLCPAVTVDVEQVLLKWCMEHYFELVQIPDNNQIVDHIKENEDNNDTPFNEKYGYDRVLQALECHMWPYRENRDDKPEKEEFSDFVSNPYNSALNELQDTMDDEADNFEELFANMARMKEVAGQLPDDERKKFAEKVALSFWRSLGGDESEIEGLTDL